MRGSSGCSTPRWNSPARSMSGSSWRIPATDDVQIVAVRGSLGHIVGHRQPRGVGVTGHVMEHNRPVRIEDVLADPRTWDREAVSGLGMPGVWLAVHSPMAIALRRLCWS